MNCLIREKVRFYFNSSPEGDKLRQDPAGNERLKHN